MDARDTVRELVNTLPKSELRAARRYLEYLCDQGELKTLADAPIDDEPSSPEEDASCEEAWEQRHEGLTLEEAKRELL